MGCETPDPKDTRPNAARSLGDADGPGAEVVREQQTGKGNKIISNLEKRNPQTGQVKLAEGMASADELLSNDFFAAATNKSIPESTNREIPELPKPEADNIDINDQTAIEKYLREQYNATFSNDNESYQVYGNPVTSRRPTLQEVQVVKSALERFGLATKGGEEIKFVFASQPIPNHTHATNIYESGKVFFPPDYNQIHATGQSIQWFVKDTKGSYRQEGSPAVTNMSVEGNLLHELGHWMDDRRDHIAWRKDRRKDDLNKRWGFGEVNLWIPDGLGGLVSLPQPAIIGKDNNERFLRHPNTTESLWLRYNTRGDYLGTVTFDQMRQAAQIPPGTIFWVSSMEASADAKTSVAYIAGESRESVKRKSLPAYLAAVIADQEDINFARPGEGLMRANNGRLVKMTQENLDALDPMARQALLAMIKH